VRQPSGELFERTFGSQISRHTSEAHVGSIRRNVHDPASVLDHLRGLLHREIRALGVQGKDLVEFLFGRFDQRLKGGHPGIVHQNVQPPKPLECFSD
jgi:hypothetical protein